MRTDIPTAVPAPAGTRTLTAAAHAYGFADIGLAEAAHLLGHASHS